MKPQKFDNTPWGALAVLEAIADCGTKRLPKEAILKVNKGNSALQELFGWTYSKAKFYVHPDFLDGIVEGKKIRAPQDGTGEANFAEFVQLLQDLSNRRVTGAKALAEVEKFFKRPGLFEKEARWYAKVMDHDFDIGIREGMIEKIWPKFYRIEAKAGKGKPTYMGCQTCLQEVVGTDYDFEYPQRAEIKKDGFRVTFVSDGGKCIGFTRGGHTYPLLKIFSDIFAKIPGFVFDTECFYRNFNKSLIFRRLRALSDEEMTDLVAKARVDIVDCVPLDQYYDRRVTTKFRKRLKLSKKFVKKLKNSRIRVMYGRTIHNSKELAAFLKEVLAKKHEGLVVKDLNGGYVCDRSPEWRKIKPQKDRTVIVIGVEEGEDRLSGSFGAFVCRDPKTKDEFNCGGSWRDPVTGKSSLNDVKRKWLWKNRKHLIGAKIDVIEQDEQKGQRKSMYARFKGFRGKPFSDKLLKEWLALK